jgi:hypothetical protein
MRTLCTRPYRGELEVAIDLGDGACVRVRGSVKWRKRVGFRRFIVGMAFLDVTPNVARQLTELSLSG